MSSSASCRNLRNKKHARKNASTSTPTDIMVCRSCQCEQEAPPESANPPIDRSIMDDYLSSLNYINSCHSIINEILKTHNGGADGVSMPALPNFLSVLSYMAQPAPGDGESRNLDHLDSLMQNLTNPIDGKEHGEAVDVKTEPGVTNPTPKKAPAEASAKKRPAGLFPHEIRTTTGIPRRIKSSTSGTDKSRSKTPLATCASAGDTSALDMHKSQMKIAVEACDESPPTDSPRESEDTPRQHTTDMSDIPEVSDTASILSNEELDHYAKQLLLGSGSETITETASSHAPRAPTQKQKVRKVKSKTSRDYQMIKSYLKQWGFDMQSFEDGDCGTAALGEKSSQEFLETVGLEQDVITAMTNFPMELQKIQEHVRRRHEQEQLQKQQQEQHQQEQLQLQLQKQLTELQQQLQASQHKELTAQLSAHVFPVPSSTQSLTQQPQEHALQPAPSQHNYPDAGKKAAAVTTAQPAAPGPAPATPPKASSAFGSPAIIPCDSAASFIDEADETDPDNYITNEQPVWLQSSTTSPDCESDESDIEPDHEQDIINYKQMQIQKSQSNINKNPKASYVIRTKPKDRFLVNRRRRSHSDMDSEREGGYIESDIDDEIFDNKRRSDRSPIKVREPTEPKLPQKVLSNIGILTQSGRVKPEKEQELQAMRCKLSSDMQSTLFRKPRNRKTETNDILRIPNEKIEDSSRY